MASQVKNYFLAPSLDYPPGGLLALGNIITSPKRPVPPLAAAPKLPPPQVQSLKQDFSWTRGHTSSTILGIWSKFVQLIELGVSTDISRTKKEIYSFKRIETTELFPDDDVVRSAVSAQSVQRYLERQHFQKHVYMIVGIKTVVGASIKSAVSSAAGADLKADMDLSLVGGPPVGLGPEIGAHNGKQEDLEAKDDGAFVFAFRIRKVRIHRSGRMDQAEYNRNALLGLDDDHDERGSQSIVCEGLESTDTNAEDFQLGSDKVFDEQEEVQIAFM